MTPIDLRSDTVSQPSPAMRTAMASACVGDDGFGDDPTVHELEERAAALLGKEAGLFVSSGTMGNLVALLAHTEAGNEVILGDQQHIVLAEVAGGAMLGRVQLRTVTNGPRGELPVSAVQALIRPSDVHFPNTALVCMENTHNRRNGAALSRADMAPVIEVAHAAGLPVHIDGARIFNAAVARGVAPAELVADADTVQFCLSKGLACPIGSMLVGPAAFIHRARRYRQMVGGTMRQAGILAAAGLVALEEMIARLAEDHANARLLARGVAAIPGLECDATAVETNIIYYSVHCGAATEFVRRMAERGVLVGGGRMVTHYGVEASDIETVLGAAHEVARMMHEHPVAV